MSFAEVEPRSVRLGRNGVWSALGAVGVFLFFMVFEAIRQGGDVMLAVPGALGGLTVGCICGLCMLPALPRRSGLPLLYGGLLSFALVDTVVAIVRMLSATDPSHAALAVQAGFAALAFLAAAGMLAVLRDADGRTSILSPRNEKSGQF